MSGGIKAWEGLKAEGAPETGMAYFTVASSPGDLIGLAWVLEEGSRRFYSELSGMNDDDDSLRVFRGLAAAEEGHKLSLVGLYKDLLGGTPDVSVFSEKSGDVMEGGVHVAEALAWAGGKGPRERLEMAISLEVNSYDLYLKMQDLMEEEESKLVFRRIALEEKGHLSKLADLLDMKL